MRDRWSGMLVVACLVVAGIGCTGPLGDQGGDDGTFVTLLSLVADTGDNRSQVYLADWSAASELAGEEQPDDADEVLDWVLELDDELEFAFNPTLAWWSDVDENEAFADELGFHFGQIDGSIVAGEPPDVSTALIGRFDPDDVADTVEEDGVWSDRLEVVEYDGEEFYSWGDEPDVSPEDVTTARPLGQGGNLFVTESEVFWTLAVETMEEMLDARSGDGSLADDDDLREVAEALDDHDAFVATITEPIDGSGLPGVDAGREEGGPLLAAYDHLAVANVPSDDGDGQRGLILLLNEDEKTAEENAERLEEVLEDGASSVNGQPWDEALDLDEVTTDGRLTIAVVEFDEASPRLLSDAIFRRDSLYWYES